MVPSSLEARVGPRIASKQGGKFAMAADLKLLAPRRLRGIARHLLRPRYAFEGSVNHCGWQVPPLRQKRISREAFAFIPSRN